MRGTDPPVSNAFSRLWKHLLRQQPTSARGRRQLPLGAPAVRGPRLRPEYAPSFRLRNLLGHSSAVDGTESRPLRTTVREAVDSS
jgi:hypothetical protein